jgi:PD-(D/E)XK nuclease family transposase
MIDFVLDCDGLLLLSKAGRMANSFEAPLVFLPGTIMPLGIRPTIDFPFKKTFGAEENKIALISLLKAILDLASPIVDVTLLNPFNRT